MAFEFSPSTSVASQPFNAPQSAQMGAPVSGNALATMANLSNIDTQQQALKKAQATYGSDVQAAKAQADTATANAQSAQVKLGNEQMNTMYSVLAPYGSDQRLLKAASLNEKSTPDDFKAVQNSLYDVSDEIDKGLEARGWGKADRRQYIHELNSSIMKDPRSAPELIKRATQTLAGAANIAEQNQPQFEKNAAGEIIQVQKAKGQVSPVGGGGGNANPTTGGVASTTDYIKDLGSRVQSGILMDIKLNEAEHLLGQFKAGAGTKAYQDVAQRLQAIGAPQDLVDKVSGGDLSAIQSVNKFIAQAVTQGAAQAGGGGTTANILNEYVKNNPDVNNDPRALKRFIEFAKKQNELSYKENEFLLQQKQGGKFNPETHIQEMQQHLREQYLGPQKKEGQETSKDESKTQEAKPARKIVKEGVDKRTGQKVVQYDDGTIGYK